MDFQPIINLVGTVFYVAMSIITTTSVVVHARVPWWKTRMGRHLMIYMGAFALTLDLGVVKLLVGDSLGFQILRLAAFALLPFAMAQRLWLQIRAQRRGTVEPPQPADNSEPHP